MARWGLKGGGRLLALATGVAVAACWAGGSADAQEPALVFEKQLDLSLNPMPSGVGKGAQAVEDRVPVDGQVLRLPALVPGTDTSGERSARIILGTASKPGAWRSVLNFRSAYVDASGAERSSVCGATLIDDRWALTAAHCVFRVTAGGVRDLKWVTAFADDVRFQKGKPLRVRAVYVNREYDEGWLLNDAALLHLEAAVALPRQKLARGGGQSIFQAAGTLGTVVGWGRTKGGVPGSLSAVLLQANLPIARKDECDRFRQAGQWAKPGQRPLTDAEFCAGHGGGETPMICNGDSGGPLFVSSSTGEPIQAGIVSWVRGACVSTYGGFANVAHFEQWIAKHVPKAVFVKPQPAVALGPLAQIAGVAPGGPPAPLGQCAVDIYADGAAINAAKIGSELTVRVTTGVTGYLAVFSHTSEGKVAQIFPTRYAGTGAARLAPMAVRAGDVVAIPAEGFSLKVTPPSGRYTVIAIVMPEGSSLASLAQRFQDTEPIQGFGGVLAQLAEEARQMPADTPRAVCTRQFEVKE